jgi:hypothetical protein
VHWCLDCRSSLAEAEVEYEDRTSPSIDVLYAVVDGADLAQRFGLHAAVADANVVIWTTTPWTLPASQAVTLGAELGYVLARLADGALVVVAEELLAAVSGRAAKEVASKLAPTEGQSSPVGGSSRAPRARNSKGCNCITLSSSAWCRSCWVTMSRSTPARAACTPRRATAWKTFK